MNESDITVEGMAVGQSAVAVVSVAGDDSRVGQGWAKCHPTDTPKPQVGLNLAVARALEDLAKQYHRQAKKEMRRK